MGFIRWFLGRIILGLDFITTPKGIKREADAQAEIDAATDKMALYQFQACPFCVKVRRHLKRHSLDIELRDAKNDEGFKDELTTQGGRHKVPCLRTEDAAGKVTWLYESSDIIQFLETEFKLA